MAFFDDVLIVIRLLFVSPESQRPVLYLAVQRPSGAELDQEEEWNCEQEEYSHAVSLCLLVPSSMSSTKHFLSLHCTFFIVLLCQITLGVTIRDQNIIPGSDTRQV